MNIDYGSRDPRFIQIISDVRNQLLKVANASPNDYTTIIIQGSGTYGIESTMGTAIPRDCKQNKVLIASNGAYGQRMQKICQIYGITHSVLNFEENKSVDAQEIFSRVKKDVNLTHFCMVHSETTAGVLNPIHDICPEIKKINPNVLLYFITTMIDTVSSFGVYEINMNKLKIDYAVSTANKNLQGVPGFSFIIANKLHLKKCKNNSRSLALDAYDQWENMEKTGQFRFTPPTHSMKALQVALKEFFNEGGTIGRNRRKLTKCDSFRIGSIGELYKSDMKLVVDEIRNFFLIKNIPIPVPY